MDNEQEILTMSTEKLSKELPVLRKMCNLTQKNLGDIVGVSRQTITNIESGKCEMKWTLFLALILVFGLERNSCNYLKEIGIPYKEIKEIILDKIDRNHQMQ